MAKYGRSFVSGTYHVHNTTKYRGSNGGGGARAAQYRSSWELRLMGWLDSNPNVVEWGSERMVVQYVDKVDGRVHRYFVDFDFVVRGKDGNLKRIWCEVKPDAETRPPVPPRRMTESAKRNLLMKNMTYVRNQSKWEAAIAEARRRGATFMVLTEKNASFFNG